MKIKITRRLFLKELSDLIKGVGVSVVILPLISCENDWIVPPKISGKSIELDLTNERSDILNLPVLNFLGAGLTKQFEEVNYGIPVIIVRFKRENKEDDFLCFSGMCTHDQCFGKNKVRAPLKIETLSNGEKVCRVICTCHGSEFDLLSGGKVLKGPAEKPLRKFECSFNPSKNILTIYY
ncbi:MAG: Rieske (2Fe-2S) protein [Ignavibacteria bacterium]|nr:Rieske (2Fe-2S) protein [Ignavibacteria bacterium]